MATPIPDFPVRDLKLEALAKFAHESWILPELKNRNLEPIAASFRANIALVRFMMLLPTSIVGQTNKTRRYQDLAEYQITQQLGSTTLSADAQKSVDDRTTELLNNDWRQMIELRDRSDSADWDKYVGEYHLGAARALGGLTETPLGAYGFIPMFSSCITGAWTAVETMLGDLWEAALNAHPKVLAALNGAPQRIAGTGQPKGRKNPAEEGKSIDLNLVAENNFDLRDTMGTLFRRERRFEFTRLSSCRVAYSRAFSEKSSRIDAALNSKSLDALSAVRNLLLHKAATVDAAYVTQTSYLPIPKLKLGDKLPLDGELVASLIQPAIASSRSLMIAVDDWVDQN